jgi:hypothetical protein
MSRRRVTAVMLSALLAVAAVEVLLRFAPQVLGLDPQALSQLRAAAQGEGLLDYAPAPHVVYTHPRSGPSTNAAGFLGPEQPRAKPPDTLRILCLGGSTTESGNDGSFHGSWPYFLEVGIAQELLRGLESPRVEVQNLGLAGWTSAETLVHWFLRARDHGPDLVLIHDGVNDVAPRQFAGFTPDYSHYRRSWRSPLGDGFERWAVAHWATFAALRLRRGLPTLDQAVRATDRGREGGGLEPDGRRVFRRNVECVLRDARSLGAQVGLITHPVRAPAPGEEGDPWRVGIAEHNQVLRELAAEHGCLLIDLEVLAAQDPQGLQPYFRDLVHLEPPGNLWKALHVGAVLAEGWEPLREARAGQDR